MPSISETGNVKAYFSCDYQTYGINFQAFMLPLLHLEEQMILQNLEKRNTVR